MYRALSKYPGKSWLVSTGAVTNVALLFAVYPKLAEQIAGLSIMGGVIGGFFTNAPLGRLNTRLTLSDDLYKLFPAGLPDDSGMTIAEVAKHFQELGILKGNEDLDDERTRLLLEQARLSFGNTTPFAEFNVGLLFQISKRY
jgi:uridine nucleosidase